MSYNNVVLQYSGEKEQREYQPGAYQWITSQLQQDAIANVAAKLGLSKSVIAGAMIEEFDSYLNDYPSQSGLDFIVQLGNQNHSDWATRYV